MGSKYPITYALILLQRIEYLSGIGGIAINTNIQHLSTVILAAFNFRNGKHFHFDYPLVIRACDSMHMDVDAPLRAHACIEPRPVVACISFGVGPLCSR